MTSMQNSWSRRRKAINSRIPGATALSGCDMSLPHRRVGHFGLQGLAARRCDHSIDVQDEGDAAIAEDGGSRDARDVGIIGLEALDDDLALALDGIDHQG